jgi:hypothetical protein
MEIHLKKTHLTFSLVFSVEALASGMGLAQSQKMTSLKVPTARSLTVGWKARLAMTVPLSVTSSSLPP